MLYGTKALRCGPTVDAALSRHLDVDMMSSTGSIFGPVLVIPPFDSEDEAIAMAKVTDFGPAADVRSGDATRIARRLCAGTIQINGRGTDDVEVKVRPLLVM